MKNRTRDMLGEADLYESVPISSVARVSHLVGKWAPLLENIEEDLPAMTSAQQVRTVKAMTAFMFESQAKAMRGLAESTAAMNVGPWMKFIYPIIRRAATQLIAPRIASVQPMNGPVGGVAFFRLKYQTDKGQIRAGDEMNKVFSANYSSEFVDGEQILLGDGATTNWNGLGIKFVPIRPGTFQLRLADPDGALLATDNGAGALLNPAGGTIGSVDYRTGQVNVTFASAPASGVPVYSVYRTRYEMNTRRPEVGADFELQEIKAETRTLTMLASLEALEDARNLWNTDLEAEIVAQASNSVATETDRAIIRAAYDAVEPVAIKRYDKATRAGIDESQHLKSLNTQLNRLGRLVQKRTNRARTNWAVIGSEMAALFDSMDGYVSSDDGSMIESGIAQSGVLSRRLAIYVDPLSYSVPENEILVGYTGTAMMDNGIVYSPYVPLDITAPFMDPRDNTIRRTIRTRDKITVTRREFFGKLIVKNLEQN